MDSPSPPTACPWCGLTLHDDPHQDTNDCIRALEKEIRVLRALLESVTEQPTPPRSEESISARDPAHGTRGRR